MSYCLYVRKSRADAEAELHGEGETLARHTKILLELAKRRHLEVTQIYREIVSGETIAARPVMQQLLSEVEQGMWDGVLVMEIERLARGDTIDQGIVAQTFRYSDTKIITPMKDYDPNNEFDEEYFEFGLFMSRREYKTINRRLQRGRIASVKEGNFVGNKAPYGYARKKNEHEKGFTLVPLEDEADVVKMIYSLYTKGEKQPDGSYERLGVSLIVRRLNDLHIPPRTSDCWIPATVRDILRNPVYIGKIRWNWRKCEKKMTDGQLTSSRPRASADEYILADGKHTPIIDEETYNQAQHYLSFNPPNPTGKKSTMKNPLSGLVFCNKCGRAMVRRPYGNGYPDILMCSNTNCKNVSSALSLVEARVISSIREWVNTYDLEWEKNEKNENISVIKMKEKSLKKLYANEATLKKQLDSTHDLLEQGIYSVEQFLDRSKTLAEKMQQNKEETKALEKEIANDKRIELNRALIIPQAKHLLDIYSTLSSPKSKNDMLKSVLQKVTYNKDSGCRWHGSLEDFTITIYPHVPNI